MFVYEVIVNHAPNRRLSRAGNQCHNLNRMLTVEYIIYPVAPRYLDRINLKQIKVFRSSLNMRLRKCSLIILVICFHKPDEENGFLSNWYMSDFSVDGAMYSSMEQYMMYMKAKVFKDEVIGSQIFRLPMLQK